MSIGKIGSVFRRKNGTTSKESHACKLEYSYFFYLYLYWEPHTIDSWKLKPVAAIVTFRNVSNLQYLPQIKSD